MQAKAMRNYHLHHPFDDSLAAWPSDPPETVRKLADIMRSHAKAKMQTPAEPPLRDLGQQATHPFFKPHAPPASLPPVPTKRARRKRGAPAPHQAGKAATSRPPASHMTHPANPDQASSSSSLQPLQPPHLDQASSSSSLPPPAPPPPEAYPGFEEGAKVQQPFCNDHTGDWIWCESTIQYRLRDLGDNRGATDPGDLAPSKGARLRQQRPGQARRLHPGAHQRPPHPIPHQREQGPQRHQIHWGAPPWSGAKAFPRRACPSARHPAKSPWAPVPLPDGARAEGTSPHSPGPPPPRLLSTSSTSTTRPSHTPRTPQPPSRSSRWHRGRGGFPTSSPSRNKAYIATNPQRPPPYIPRTRKRRNATGTRGPPCTPKPASTSNTSTTSAAQGG